MRIKDNAKGRDISDFELVGFPPNCGKAHQWRHSAWISDHWSLYEAPKSSTIVLHHFSGLFKVGHAEILCITIHKDWAASVKIINIPE
eukprot:2580973-Ditylum_brightwellii.AAC.1